MEDPHENIRDSWVKQTDWYANRSKTTLLTSSVFQSFVHMLDLKQASSVLEVGCGTGNGIAIILENSNDSLSITATDLTPSLLDIAREANYPRTTIQEANNEFLPFEANSFDRYIANMSLMIVHNPMNMIKEAFRVVRTGSICGFSLFGSREKSNLINLAANALEGVGIHAEQHILSFFHLNDKERLRGMFLEAGFSKVYMTENVHIYPSIDIEETMVYYNAPIFLKSLEGTPDFDRACQAIREAVSKEFEQGNVLGLATIIVIAIK